MLLRERGLQIDVGQCIQFADHDIDIVRPDPGAQRGDVRSAELAGVGREFTVVCAVFDPIEMPAEHLHARRIAHEQHQIAQLIGLHGKMVDRTIRVKHEFTFVDRSTGRIQGDGVHVRSRVRTKMENARSFRWRIDHQFCPKTRFRIAEVRANGSSRMRSSSSASNRKSPSSARSVT